MNVPEIRKKLGTMKKVSGRDFYRLIIGRFELHIFTSPRSFQTDDNILQHETVDINVNEVHLSPSGNEITDFISIRDDEPFKNYEPIHYNKVITPNGYVNLSDGRDMPIAHLCELIRYLYRLSNLTAFE